MRAGQPKTWLRVHASGLAAEPAGGELTGYGNGTNVLPNDPRTRLRDRMVGLGLAPSSATTMAARRRRRAADTTRVEFASDGKVSSSFLTSRRTWLASYSNRKQLLTSAATRAAAWRSKVHRRRAVRRLQHSKGETDCTVMLSSSPRSSDAS